MSEGTDNVEAPPTTGGDAATEAVRERIVETLKTVYDPEIPVDIYEMGLIYRVEIKDVDDNDKYPVDVVMTLTSPMCPVAETLPPEVETKVRSVEGVGDVHLDLVWDPPWTPDMMSEVAKLALNM
jgi:FeS assembly SUF system protein